MSIICRVHVPSAFSLSNEESVPSGLKDPVNGAVPAVIEPEASSSNTVSVKLSPLLPRLSTRSTVVASGLISRISTSPS